MRYLISLLLVFLTFAGSGATACAAFSDKPAFQSCCCAVESDCTSLQGSCCAVDGKEDAAVAPSQSRLFTPGLALVATLSRIFVAGAENDAVNSRVTFFHLATNKLYLKNRALLI